MEVTTHQQNREIEDISQQIIQKSIDASKYEKTCETVTLKFVNPFFSFEKEECRICLEGNQQQALIQSCSCKGSVRLVHKTCLTIWLQKKMEDVCVEDQDIQCELCHRAFNYRILTTKKFECQQFAKNWENKKASIVISLLFNTLILAGFIWFNTIAFTGENQINRKIQKIVQLRIITIVLMIIWGFFILVLFHSFISSYFLKVIKKPIIEEKAIYRVLIMKKNIKNTTNK